jgi:uncharacterized membrane protein
MKSSTPIRELTAAARSGLSGSWGTAIGVLIVCGILLIGVSLIPWAGQLLQTIFSAPLVVGMAAFFLAVVRGQSTPFRLLFSGFDRFGTALCTYLLVLLFTLLWMLPFFILMLLIVIFVHPDPAIFPPLTLVALEAIVILSLTFVMILVQMRYGLALYVVADDPSVRAREAVKRSVELMAGNYWRLGLLWLRFIGWQLLAVLTLGIGFIWLVPYYMAAMAAFYDDLTTNGHEGVSAYI